MAPFYQSRTSRFLLFMNADMADEWGLYWMLTFAWWDLDNGGDSHNNLYNNLVTIDVGQ